MVPLVHLSGGNALGSLGVEPGDGGGGLMGDLKRWKRRKDGGNK